MTTAVPRLVRRTSASFAAIACTLLASGCRDGIDPVAVAPAATLQGASASYTAYFLPPLGADHPSTAALATGLSPVVEVCAWNGTACDATVARFVTGAGPAAIRTTPDAAGARGFYHVEWKTSASSLRAGATYRIQVRLEGRELAHTDVQVADGRVGASRADVTRIQNGRTLPIKFRIEAAAVSPRLMVVIDDGVTGTPAASDQAYPRGTRVQYSFALRPGYENLLVSLDRQLVRASGTVQIDSVHMLYASADRTIVLTARGEAILRRMRGLLTAEDPAAEMQAILNMTGELADELPAAELRDQLGTISDRAWEMPRDSAAVRSLNEALHGHTFVLSDGSSAPATAFGLRSLSAAGDAPEPVTVVHTNGIFTDIGTAGYQTRLLDRIARGASLPNPLRVELLYNYTIASMGPDPKANEQARCLQDLANASPARGGNTVLERYARCRSVSFWLGTFDLVEALRQMLERAGVPFGAETDAIHLANRVDALMKAKQNVVLVPHSQGNLMAMQAVSTVKERQASSGLPVEQCLSAISVASPTSYGWPLTQGKDLEGHIAQYDFLLWLPLNRFQQIPTVYGNRLRDEAFGDPETAESNFFLWQYYRFKIHLPFNTYFVEQSTTGEIQANLQRLAALKCAGQPRTYRGSWTRDGGGSYNAFEAVVTVADGKPTVKWTFLPGSVREGTVRMEGEKVVWEYTEYNAPVTHRLAVVFDDAGCAGSWHHEYSENDFWQYTTPQTCALVANAPASLRSADAPVARITGAPSVIRWDTMPRRR